MRLGRVPAILGPLLGIFLGACDSPLLQQTVDLKPPTQPDQTNPDCAPDVTPSELTFSVSEDRIEINWSWDNGATGVDGFIVERNPQGSGWVEFARPAATVRTFSDAAVVRDSYYGYRIKAFIGTCATAASNEVQAYTYPNAPGSVSVQTVSVAELSLSWSDTNQRETGYRIESRRGGAGSFAVVADLAADTTEFDDTDLLPDSLYEYRFIAVGTGDVETTATASGWTLPNEPTGLGVTTISITHLNLAWTDTNTNETAYRVDRRAGPTGSFTTIAASLAANTTSYQDTAVAADTQYYYQVYAMGSGGTSDYAESGGWTLPVNVSGLSATTLSTTSIRLDWTDPNSNETAFKIERSPAGAGTYAVLTSTYAAGSVSYTDNAVVADSHYDYRVTVINNGGNSASATTDGWTLPNVPTGLGVTTVSTTQLDLAWTDTNTNETAYRVDRRTGPTGSFTTIAASLPANTTSYQDTAVAADTQYYYQVYAVGAGGTSDYVESSGWTLPGNVSGLSATTLSTTSIRLDWTDPNSNETAFKIERSPAGAGTYAILTSTHPTGSTSYTDTGVAADSHYDYRVTVINNGGNSASATTDGWTLPNAPTGLGVTTVSTIQLNLAWTDTNTNETAYRVDRRAGSTGSFTTIATSLAANTTSYQDTAVAADTQYYYQVYAVGSGGTSDYVEASGWTLPANVSGLSATTLSTTSIRLDWTDPNSNETAFRIERSPAGAGTYAILTSTYATGSVSYTDNGVVADSHYDYRVTVINAGGNSASATTDGWTLPNAPTGLGVTTVSTTQLNLLWTDTNTNETAFRVDRRAGPTGSFTTIAASLPANSTSYPDTTAAADTQYYYRVHAVNIGGTSSEAESSGWTLPGIVTGLSATTLSTTSIRIDWTDPNSNETAFRIERSPAGAGTYAILTSTLPTGSTSDTDTGVVADSHYDYRVTVINNGGNSASATADGWTLPNAPTGLGVTTVSTTQLNLAWTDTNTNETGYRVERVSPVASWSKDANTTSHADTGLLPNTTYGYRVVAVGPGGDSSGATASDRTSANPVLAWSGAPTLEDTCNLVVDGTLTLDSAKSATLSSASGTIEKVLAPNAVTAGAFGIEGTLNDLAWGSFNASWEVGDTLGGAATLTRALQLDFLSPVVMTSVQMPTLVLGQDAMIGRQVWFTVAEPTPSPGVCYGCTGRRGSVSLGVYHSCVVNDARGVSCWGNNSNGQLGDGGTIGRYTPGSVCATGIWDSTSCSAGTPLTNVVAIEAGTCFTCALLITGEVNCWGRNTAGELGAGMLSTQETHPAAVCENGTWDGSSCAGGGALGGVSAVSAGHGHPNGHACALMDSGEVKCWGNNDFGQIGDGSSGTARLNPVNVCASGSAAAGNCVALSNIVAVSAGHVHTCVVTSAGQVKCWGTGILGDGAASSMHVNPTTVCASGTGGSCVPLTGVIAVSANADDGLRHTCALLSNGRVECWGTNWLGQLGDGTLADRVNPVFVCATGSTTGGNCVPLENTAAITAGYRYTCSLSNSGGVRCWGDDYSMGALGVGLRPAQYVNPAGVCATGSWDGTACAGGALLSGITALSAGWYHTCAIAGDKTTTCWGYNQSGMLGVSDTTTHADNPVTVCGGAQSENCSGAQAYTGASLRACGTIAVSVP